MARNLLISERIASAPQRKLLDWQQFVEKSLISLAKILEV
jgi:hypothetical protein